MLLLFCGGGGIDTFLSNLSITNESVSLVVVVILELRYIGGVLVYASIGLRTHHPPNHSYHCKSHGVHDGVSTGYRTFVPPSAKIR